MIRFVTFIMLLVASHHALASNKWPEVPIPQEARVAQLGDELRMNGVPARMYGLEIYHNYASTKNYYKKLLTKINPMPVVELPSREGGVTLFQTDGNFAYTISLAPQTSNSTAGTILITAPGMAKARKLEFPLPANTEILSENESTDEGQYSRYILASHESGDLPYFKRFLLKEMEKVGYNQDDDMTSISKDKKKETLFFSGINREARVTLAIDKKQGNLLAEIITVNTSRKK